MSTDVTFYPRIASSGPSAVTLTRQDHYDYGLRNLKAVLNMAGALKRADPNMNEEAILMRALRCHGCCAAGIIGA